MKRWLLALCLLLVSTGTIFAQPTLNLLGQRTYTQELSDIWGYADGSGNEYALVGVYNGFSIVDVTNPATPNELFFVPGAGSIWRDVKEWDGYAYVTNESSGGLLIVNLNYLPDSIQTTTVSPLGMSSAHNIFIDENGVGYIVGANVSVGGCIFIDCDANPTDPPVLGHYTNAYIHDVYARGDTMYTAEINLGHFRVIDVSDKSNVNAPSKTLATQSTSNNFTHNLWLSDNSDFLFTTDEVTDAFIDAYDISDLSNIKRVDMVQSNPGTNTIVHNTFVDGDFLLTSYYNDGVTVHDIKDPSALIQVGGYDTSPLYAGDDGGGFHGAWGVYPYLPSGNILATDIEEGLYVLGPNYQAAARLKGTVTDTTTGSPIFDATINILGTTATTNSSLIGEYSTGTIDSGSYDVQVVKTGYIPKTISGVDLDNGVITVLDVELLPNVAFALTGSVIDSVTGAGIANADVMIVSNSTGDVERATTDASGNFTINPIFGDNYAVYAGKWSYKTKFHGNRNLNVGSSTLAIELNEGYYDDFLFDFNWSSTGGASTGFWIQGEPNGTSIGGQPSNPGADVSNDFGEEAYVTGNSPAGGVGGDDVDDGNVILTSPNMDLSTYTDPYIVVDWWFQNDGGSGFPNDEFTIKVGDAGGKTEVLNIDATSPILGQWNHLVFKVSDFRTPTSGMYFEVETADDAPGHIVEGGIDRFLVFDAADTVCLQPLAAADADTNGFANTCIDTIQVLNNDTDPEGGSLTVSIISGPLSGSATVLADGSIEYTPGGTASITELISYQVCNDCGSCDTATLSIELTDYPCVAPNNAPVIVDVTSSASIDVLNVTTTEGTALNICVDANDADGDNLSGSIISGPSSGTATGTTFGCFDYDPTTGFIGTDEVWYQVCDDGSPSLCDTVQLIITVQQDIGIADIKNGLSLQLGPNPSSGNFSLQYNSQVAAEYSVEATNSIGETVYTVNQLPAQAILQLGDTWPAGLYYISIYANKQRIETIKAVKLD